MGAFESGITMQCFICIASESSNGPMPMAAYVVVCVLSQVVSQELLTYMIG